MHGYRFEAGCSLIHKYGCKDLLAILFSAHCLHRASDTDIGRAIGDKDLGTVDHPLISFYPGSSL